jgi:hypothetical protein
MGYCFAAAMRFPCEVNFNTTILLSVSATSFSNGLM